MEIDNSRAAAFRRCSWEYYEAYERNGVGVEPSSTYGETYSPLEFGARMHERLEEHYTGQLKYPQHENVVLETEADLTLEAYKAHYPDEQLDIVDVERTIRVQLPGSHHIFIGKIDLILRSEGRLDIWDHKTEKRGAKSNLPQKWAARDQASLYLWALGRLYPDQEIGNFYVNILTRQSEKGLIGPSFPERQKLERSTLQKEIAVRDLVLVADTIEDYRTRFGTDPWPANRENCYGWGYCPYYAIHGYGEDIDLILEHKYQPKKEYLNLGGVPIIQ